MSRTELQLVAVYGPMVPLTEVCKPYFNLSPDVAKKRAALNALPVPTFRLIDSQKAPYLIRASDLATYIDSTHEAALAEWEKSQV
jgi:hypothetical protein